MLRIVKELYGYNVRAVDGDIGEVHDFYFDDQFWTIRYLVVDPRKWLSGRKVLISPVVLGEPNWKEREFPVSLIKEQVKNSPDIGTDKPLSRQHEENLHKYYSWPFYWDYEAIANVGPMMSAQAEKKKLATEKGEEDPHLRSTKEIIDYRIHAIDGEIGHVQDFVVEDKSWVIRYMVVDTRNWLPGKKVLVSPDWIERISWADSEVYVDLPREVIKGGPRFDPRQPVNREYEERMYDLYGRPRYWV
jgi:sporulation protein YlmC with PRC-barrel domain